MDQQPPDQPDDDLPQIPDDIAGLEEDIFDREAQRRKALEIAINNGAKNGCDICIINGDLMDFYQFSRFDKNPDIMRHFFSEREWVQDFLLLLQKTFGKVVYKKGNHDIRRELYLQRKAMDMPEIQEMLHLLRCANANINQIARHLHDTGRIYDTDLEEILGFQKETAARLNDILTKLSALK